MIAFLKQHFGSILIAIAIVLAAYIYAESNRYTAHVVRDSSGDSHIEILDKRNGTATDGRSGRIY